LEFGQQGHRFQVGQFRLLAEREDESGMVVVTKGTIKRMDDWDRDERGQPYDPILPESSLKGNSPGPERVRLGYHPPGLQRLERATPGQVVLPLFPEAAITITKHFPSSSLPVLYSIRRDYARQRGTIQIMIIYLQ